MPDLIDSPGTPRAEPPPPWLRPHWTRLWSAHRAGRLPHALLLSGPAGIGKRLLTRRLAHALLCSRPDAERGPCGACAECRLSAAGTHPDFRSVTVQADAKGNEIRVDQIRAVIHDGALTGHRGARRVVQIAPAETMNTFAANGLLKTLEEPADGLLLLLISEQPSRLPATILSRCQRIALTLPAKAQALAWLEPRLPAGYPEPERLLRVANGAPLRALDALEANLLALRDRILTDLMDVGRGRCDPVATAAAWQPLDATLVLNQLVLWVIDVLRIGVDPAAVHLANPDRRAQIAQLAERMSAMAAHGYLRHLLQARALAETPINKLLLFESLLVRWALVARGGH